MNRKATGYLPATQWLGLFLLVILAIAAFAGPDLYGMDPAKQSLRDTLHAPSWAHPFGTDHLGRDMLARILAGAQVSLSLAALAVVSAAIPGTVLGLVAAWRPGWSDSLISTFADAVLALPGLLLVLILAAIAPGNWWVLYLGIALTLWVEYFRYTRQRARVLLNSPAVQAAQMLGFGPVHILKRHVLPELTSGLLTLAAFGIATSVTAMAALGFVSVGLRPPASEWGLMMTQLLPYWREAPWLIIQPILCLMLTVIAVHLAVGQSAVKQHQHAGT